MFYKGGQAIPFFANLVLLLCTLFLLTGCLQSLWPFSENTHYRITGVDEEQEQLKTYLDKILQDRLAQEIDKTDNEQENARRETYREENIQADLAKALRAKGYYEGAVEYRDDEAAEFTGTYIVKPGPRYTVSAITIEPEKFQDAALPGLETGDYLDAEKVLSAQASLYEWIQANNCYYALDVQNSVVLNRENGTGSVTLQVQAGQEAVFGDLTFQGSQDVKHSYLGKLAAWQPGECYRHGKIEALRRTLLETGLFAQAEAILPERPDKNGTVPVTIKLQERAPRSVNAGVSYYTDEGFGTRLGWEHRNLLGGAEKLEAVLNISQLKQIVSVDFSKPFFISKKQTLGLSAALRRQQTDAFDEQGLELGGFISRDITANLSGSLGADLLLTEISERDDEKLFGLISTPGSLTYDNRNSSLNPRKGWFLTGGVTPYFDILGESDPFLKLETGARTYFDFGTDSDIVLALRGRVGSIVGTGTFNIPASERFYAGGGGSVRGFGYQEVGPVEEDEPVGGRSLVIGSAETRFKITGDFGGAVFVDAGSVSKSATPDFQDFSVGAGAGIRYYTGFGPLRFDVAVPLNRKGDLERNYQFYVSIGQAF